MRIFHTRKVTIFSAMCVPHAVRSHNAPVYSASSNDFDIPRLAECKPTQRIEASSQFSSSHPNAPRLIALAMSIFKASS